MWVAEVFMSVFLCDSAAALWQRGRNVSTNVWRALVRYGGDEERFHFSAVALRRMA